MINPHNPSIAHEQAIKDHLIEKGCITKEEAFALCGCEDLKGTISDLREKGWNISTKRVTITQYILEEPPSDIAKP